MSFTRPTDSRILEGIITTVSPQPGDAPIEARTNIAPMGPIVTSAMDQLILRPFKTSTTYRNIRSTGEAVFHVTDDVLLLARAAVGRVVPDGPAAPVVDPTCPGPTRAAEHVTGLVLVNACRYYELKVASIDDREDRTTIVMQVVHTGRLRDCFGFNRAMHAVVEAAILATRLHLSGTESVLGEYAHLDVIVAKTGGPRERQALDELKRYVTAWQPTATARELQREKAPRT